MRLDTPTLCVVTAMVVGLLGLLFLHSWSQNRDVKALAWWGGSFAMASVATALLVTRGAIPLWLSITAGNVILYIAYGLLWAGFRTFERRPVHRPWIFAGSIAWLAACGIPAVYKSVELRILVASVLASGYVLAAAWEVFRSRAEPLGSRTPILVVLTIHTAFLLSRSPTIRAAETTDESVMFLLPWVAAHAFESLVFTITIAFLLLAITKERIEAEQRSIASRDPLTGTLNRRAFVERARDLLDGARRADRPCALVVADLDHFKAVNDRFGHAAGDQVLAGFARVATYALPAGALLVRLGGEEFGALVTEPQGGALDIAARIRADLEATRFETDHEAFNATVSIGVATTDEVGHLLDALMAAADVALYEAKAKGRNRVETASALTGDLHDAPEPDDGIAALAA